MMVFQPDLVADLDAPDGRSVRSPDPLAHEVAAAVSVTIAVVIIAGVVRVVAIAVAVRIAVGRVGSGEAQT